MENQQAKSIRRARTNFSPEQLSAMEIVFERTQYPDVKLLSTLSHKLQLPIEKLCTWFQNRRSKFRRASKKGRISWMTQQLLEGDANKPASRHGKLKVIDNNANAINQMPPLQQPYPCPDLPLPLHSLASLTDCSSTQPAGQPLFAGSPPIPAPSDVSGGAYQGQMPSGYGMMMHTQQSSLGCYSSDATFQPQWYPAQNDAPVAHHAPSYVTAEGRQAATWHQPASGPGVSPRNDGSPPAYPQSEMFA
ncbi:hypothetical protein CAPTEDRAFT_220188 [Capitella teleta]|uniref:Homeobox domain-containing protein n=1 Tax=Capitella teleta TaxID=283909 RepID=R7V0E8_CAPTE|nr:hypothetical protein CAPTEDRAFT_220188 [Capitella teleta]|eukprot:ELU12308.1 hypothetical protein CAPTEDRAFT_220188 [Capitella teleta]